MKRICPVCRLPPDDERLLICVKCKVPFIGAEPSKSSLSPEETKRIVVELLRSWRFWLALIVAIVATVWSGLQVVDYFTGRRIHDIVKTIEHGVSNSLSQANAMMTNDITRRFQEPQLRELVEGVASREAQDIVASRLSPIVDALMAEVEQLRQTNFVLQLKSDELQAQVLAIELRTKDRALSETTKRAMLAALARVPKGRVEVAAFQSDREAVAFGEEITKLLKEAGCKATFAATPTMNATYTGLVLLVHDPANRPAYADVILSVFEAEGVAANGWLYRTDYEPDTVGIYVFPKPAAP